MITKKKSKSSKSVLTSLFQLPAYADNVALPAFARRTQLLLRTGQQSIDITCAPRQQQQTRSGFAAVGPFWDRQTDGRTDSANNGSSIHQRKKHELRNRSILVSYRSIVGNFADLRLTGRRRSEAFSS